MSKKRKGAELTFAEAWSDPAIVQEPLAQLPWSHNIALLDAAPKPKKRPAPKKGGGK